MFKARRVISVLLILLLLSVAVSAAHAQGPADSLIQQARRWLGGETAANEVFDAWQRARDAGSYRLVADAEQTLHPRALPELVGHTDSAVDMRLEAEAHLPDRAMMTLRVEADGTNVSPVKLYRLGDTVLMSEGGSLRQVQDPSNAGLGDADYLGYLAGAVDVQRTTDPSQPDVAHYTFQMDGARLAKYQTERLEEQLRSSGELPEGAQLGATGALANAVGDGEIWLDSNGLPKRQVIRLELPALSEGYDATFALTIDFYDYGCEDNLPTPVQNADGTWSLHAPSTVGGASPSNPPNAPDTTTGGQAQTLPSDQRGFVRVSLYSLVLFALALTIVVIVRRRLVRRHHVYATFVTLMALTLIVLPLLRSGQWLLFGERVAQASDTTGDVLSVALGLDEQSISLSQTASDTSWPSVPADRQMLADGSEDSDDDGLSDDYERSLGTDPLSADTDRDGIEDGVEVQGIELAGTTWTSNPCSFDSNSDDLTDRDEWAEPEGMATDIDPDGDGIPNFWDEDNDNDDLPDGVDLSPMAVGEYGTEFAVSTDGGETFDGHLYLEFQVQPEDPDHLRYSTTSLDWPHDEKGQMTDLDESTDDLRLTPFLRIDSNVAPPADLSRSYGMRSWAEGDRYVIMAPLNPVSDGGKIRAFYTKVALSPNDNGHVPDLDWNTQMIWVVQATADVEGNDNKIIQRESALHRYIDTFRLTGFTLCKSKGFDTLLVGTPGSQYEDRDLIQTFLGLNGLFMEYDRLQNQAPSGETALEHLHYRFQHSWPVTYTLGANPANAQTAYHHYAHEDEALGDASTDLIPAFLNDHYSTDAVCPTGEDGDISYASLIIATEHTYGQRDLADWSGDTGSVFGNLADLPLVRVRTTRLAAFTTGSDSDGWGEIELARLLEVMELRYRDRWSDLAAELDDLYPHLKNDTMRYMTTVAYVSAFSGNQSVVACGDTLFIEPGPVDDAEIASRYGVSDLGRSFDDLPKFFAWVSGLGEYLDMAIADAEREWGEDGSEDGTFSANAYAHKTVEWIEDNPIAGDICGAIPEIADVCGRSQEALENYDIGMNQVRMGLVAFRLCLLAKTLWGVRKLMKLHGGFQAARAAVKAASFAKRFPKFALAGMIFSIALTWVLFGLAYSSIKDDPAALRLAIGIAIVSTIWFIFLFALNFIPIIGSIVSAILSLIDGIISLATGGSWNCSYLILKFFYDARTLTKPKSAEYGPMDSGVRDEELGLVEGNYLWVQTDFSGRMVETDDGDSDDLDESWIRGYLKASSSNTLPTTRNTGACHTHTSGSNKDCTNSPSVTFGPLVATINQAFLLYSQAEYKYRWAEYGLYGAFRWKTHSEYKDVPEDDDVDVNTVYMDVLPATLSELWSWGLTSSDPDQIWNSDFDGDGILNDDEPHYGTDPNLWDTDGDTVSDKYELDHADLLGLDPLVADCDGDGLDDGQELRRGTLVSCADTDNDGLTDGEEVYHQAPDGSWTGGWLARTPDDGWVHVYSDPLRADADIDGLTDAEERDNDLSPYAYNDSPRMRVIGSPLVQSPTGEWGTFVEPSDPVELLVELRSSGAYPVTSTLSLCMPAIALNPLGGELEGHNAPPKGIAPCAGGEAFLWDFGGEHALPLYETVSGTITFDAAALTASQRETIDLTLAYCDQQLQKRLNLSIDADAPEVTIAQPADGEVLSGDTYVVGGTARDEGSWVTEVGLCLRPVGSSTCDLEPANGLETWAYSLDLPTDGHYQLLAHATDYVDHETLSSPVNITVDNTAPTTSLDLPGGTYVRPEDGAVTIRGVAEDNLSGIRRVKISINGQPWRAVALDSPGATSTAWSYAWPVGDDAQGRHAILVRAIDRAGNESLPQAQELIVDQMAPTDELADRTYLYEPPAVAVGEPHVLVGVANESGRLASPSRPPALVDDVDVYTSTTAWLGLASITDNDQGITAAWIGDYDNDRLADLAIGMPASDRVTVLYGRSGDWAVPSDLEMLDDSLTQYVGASGSGLGHLLSAVGDADGDGSVDLLIGQTNNPRAYFAGGRPGPLGQRELDDAYPPQATIIEAPAAITHLGYAGDLNDDGLDDALIVAGDKAYLLLGRLFPWPEIIDIEADAAAIIDNAQIATGLGDINGDDIADWGLTRANAILVYYGTTGYETGEQQASLADFSFGTADAAPYLAALGDVNGDTLPDFVFSDASSPRLVLGRRQGTWTVSLSLTGYLPQPSGYLAGPGDIDGDGYCDLILSNDDDDLYLILGRDDWSAPPPIKSTIHHATAIAALPYATAADINADGSSDMLLIPEPTEAEDRGLDARSWTGLGFVPRSALYVGASPDAIPANAPARSLSSLGTQAAAANLHVDDDYCAVCDNDGHTWGVNAFDSIPAALAVADSQNNTINIRPGVYPAFTVSAGHDNLTIKGVDPDAVFVDGDGGLFTVRLQNVRNVTLSQLTLRNADRGLWLDDAGLLGNETPSYRCALEHSLVHNCENAIYSDRSSSIEVSNCTLGTDGQPAHPLIAVDASEPDPDLYQWSALDGPPTDISLGGGLYTDSGTIYALPGGNGSEMYTYNIDVETWTRRADVPSPMPEASASAVDENDDLWVLCPDEFGGFDRTVQAINVNGPTNVEIGADSGLWHYDGNAWENRTAENTQLIKRIGEDVYYGSGGSVYKSHSAGPRQILGYFTFNDTDAGDINDIVVNGDDVYVGGDFDRVDYEDPASGGYVRLNVKNIARWNASDGWQALGHSENNGLTGVTSTNYECYGVDYVNALLIKGGYLFVGGMFTQGYNVGSGGSQDECASHNLIRYRLSDGKWLQANVRANTSSGISWQEHDYFNGICDPQIIVFDLASWDSDTLLIAGKLPYYGKIDGDAWNMVFYNLTSDAWESVPSWAKTNGIIRVIEQHGDDWYFGGDFTQVGGSTAAAHVARYDSGAGTWHALSGGVNGSVHALDYSTDNDTLYVGGDFDQANGVGHFGVALWDESSDAWPGGQYFYRYHDGSWSERAPLPVLAHLGSCMSANDDGCLYVITGNSNDDFYRYNISGNTWTAGADIAVHEGSALTSVDGTLYAITGGAYAATYKYISNSWHSASGSSTTPEFDAGTDLVWDGLESLYALSAQGSDSVWRMSIPDGTWRQMDDPGTAAFATYGHGLIRRGDALYAWLTPTGSAPSLYRCARVGIPNHKLSLEQVALVAPSGASDPIWLQPSDLYADYGIGSTVSCTWVADADWTPTVAEDDTLRNVRADLVDPLDGLYRAGRRSQLVVGYRPHKGKVRVSPTYCAICDNDGLTWNVAAFDSIQSAIDSGANHVVLGPGVYQEAFYLVSGVTVAGSGADHTLVEAPPSERGALATIEGTACSTLARMSLVGNGTSQGLAVNDGATFAKASRLLIRGTATGIALDGSDTDLEMVNNTVVGNSNGIVLSGNAPLDLRNSIIAYNQDRGLLYQAATSQESHTYNDYWANGIDIDYSDSGSTPDGGAGEMFLDPLFAAMLSDDYRPLDHSPVIDAGAINDPAPPGTGSRIDMGYSENGRAAFYVDLGYGPREQNDGLTWASDAFDTIQAALDAAAITIRGLRVEPSDEGYTVNVAEGRYVEAPSIPSYVQLVGSGAPDTTIYLPKEDGAAVTFSGVVDASVSECEIVGSAGSSGAEQVEASPVTFPSISTTANGKPRASYLIDDIVFSRSDGSGWSSEIAHSVLVTQVQGLDMELDSNGYPHIIYTLDFGSWADEEMYWLYWDGYEWQHSTIEDQYAGRPVDLEIDSNDQPVVAYASRNGNVYYYVYNGSGWSSADDSSPHGGDFDFVLSSSDSRYMIYRNTDGKPRSYWSIGNSSARVTIHSSHSVLQDISAVYGPQPGNTSRNSFHVAYGDANSNSLIRAYSTGCTSWSTEVVDSGTDIGRYNAVAADSLGHTHIAYSHNGGLRYASRTSSGWKITDVADSSQGEIGPIAMTMDASDTAHILYAVASPAGVTLYRTHWDSGELTGVRVSGASHGISIDRNLIRDCTRGVVFDSRSSGAVTSSTVVQNAIEGLYAGDAYTWLRSANNVIADNALGQRAISDGQLFSEFDLLSNTVDQESVTLGEGVLYADPQFGSNHTLTAGSPALDTADPFLDVPVGGGIRADMGYRELIAAPLPLLFGKEIRSMVIGNSGVQATEMGVTLVTNPDLPVTETLPSLWSQASHASIGEPVSQWARTVTPASEGLYRVYSRASDVVGNDEADLDSEVWYTGAYLGDDTPPTVTWIMPTSNVTSDQAALLLVAECSDYVDAGDGPRFAVEEYFFLVDGDAHDAEWEDNPDWDSSAQEPRRFQASIPLKQGAQNIQAVVVDEAGHESRTSVLAATGTNPQHVATITSLVNGEAVRDRDLRLRGYVRFTGSGSGSAQVEIDSGSAIAATLDNPLARLTSWRCDASLPDSDGYHTVQVTPDQGGPGQVTTIQLLLDRVGPTLDVVRPAAGEAVTGTIYIEGTTSDALAGIYCVEFSVDGGYTWIEMQKTAGAFYQEYNLPAGEDSVSYPVRVRSRDLADNETVTSRLVSVDSQAPVGLAPTTFSTEPGNHVLLDRVLDMSWTEARDASGVATTYVAIDQTSDTVPTMVTTSTSYQRELTAIGRWYAHLMAEDAVGNTRELHYGPWYVDNVFYGDWAPDLTANRSLMDTSFADSRQSIIIDGEMDVANDEWLRSEEWLDDIHWHGSVQDLYVAWDGLALFIGYGGSWWDMDGDLWVYIDPLPGGATTAPVGGPELPIGADWAIQVSEPDTALLWQWNGSAWSSQPWSNWAMGETTGETEIRLPWSTLCGGTPGRLALLAASHEVDNNTPGAVFPTSNSRSGPWPDYYYWDDVPSASFPSGGQPTALEATIEIASSKGPSALCGPNEGVLYRITVHNSELSPITGGRFDLQASAGLAYYAPVDPLSAVTCSSCPDGGQLWNMSLPEIAADATHVFTITGRLAPSVLGLTAITSTATLWGDPVPVVGQPVVDAISNIVDGQPPSTSIAANEGDPVPVGAWQCTGTASDGSGIGVSDVEVRVIGNPWQTAAGTATWSHTLTIPDTDTVTIEARATDQYGQVGTPDVRHLAVDRVPPSLWFTPPAVCQGTSEILEGTTSDPNPASGQVSLVELQFDDPSSSWTQVDALSAPDAARVQTWTYQWLLPYEDGAVHQIRVRATDLAGLQTVLPWQATLVDSVAPHITTTQLLTEVTISDYGSPKQETILTGEISDGVAVSHVEVRVHTQHGLVYTQTVDLAGALWSYSPDVTTLPSGTNRLRVLGYDATGNLRVDGPYDFTVTRILPALTVDLSLLSVEGNSGATEGYAGDSLLYQIRVTNVADGPARNVDATADLQFPGISYDRTVSAQGGGLIGTGPAPNVTDGHIAWPLNASLEAGTMLTLTFEAHITPEIAPPEPLTAVAQATGRLTSGEAIPGDTHDPRDDDPDDRDDAVVGTLRRPFEMTLGPTRDTVNAGWNYDYVVSLDYFGSVPLDQVRVSIEIPYGSQLVATGTDPCWSQQGGAAVWTLNDVIPGQRTTGTIELHLFSSLLKDTLFIVESVVDSDQLIRRTDVVSATVTTNGGEQPPTPVPTPMLEQDKTMLLPLVMRNHESGTDLGALRAILKNRGQLDSRR